MSPLLRENFEEQKAQKEDLCFLIMWSLWARLYVLVPLQCVFQQIGACQRRPAVPSGAQLCPAQRERPACRHLPVTGCGASACDRETRNNRAQESGLGTNTARVSALEVLCFDKLPGDFSSSWFNQSCW